jgi:hypothetical protein
LVVTDERSSKVGRPRGDEASLRFVALTEQYDTSMSWSHPQDLAAAVERVLMSRGSA